VDARAGELAGAQSAHKGDKFGAAFVERLQ
jgi:hypothetical protein